MMNFFQNYRWVPYWTLFAPGLAFGLGVLFALAVVWSLVWKGLALWKAAKEGNKVWFVVMLVVNTLGILEILYIYVFSKKPGFKD